MDPVSFVTIKFNVGGTMYEVSQSLLQHFPNTMLARAASETWSKKTNVKNDPIFIDRNGERFAYVLDYMRDNKIVLPLSVTKEAMMDDLSYYGFDNIESIPISVNIPAKDLMKNSNSILDTYNNKIQASEKDLKEWTDKHRQKIDNMIQEFKDEANCLNTEIRVMKFARDCFKEAMEKEPTKMTLYKFYPIEYDANKELREKHLNMFGLSWTGKYSQTTGFEITYYEK
jgi:hypothetical protein